MVYLLQNCVIKKNARSINNIKIILQKNVPLKEPLFDYNSLFLSDVKLKNLLNKLSASLEKPLYQKPTSKAKPKTTQTPKRPKYFFFTKKVKKN